MEQPDKRTCGWAKAPNMKKAHFFVDGRSLCGNWLYIGWTSDDAPLESDCKSCQRLWEKKYGAAR